MVLLVVSVLIFATIVLFRFNRGLLKLNEKIILINGRNGIIETNNLDKLVNMLDSIPDSDDKLLVKIADSSLPDRSRLGVWNLPGDFGGKVLIGCEKSSRLLGKYRMMKVDLNVRELRKYDRNIVNQQLQKIVVMCLVREMNDKNFDNQAVMESVNNLIDQNIIFRIR